MGGSETRTSAQLSGLQYLQWREHFYDLPRTIKIIEKNRSAKNPLVTYTNNNKWKERKLSGIVFKDRIITYGIVQAGPNVLDGIPYIRAGDILDGNILTNQLLRTPALIAKSYERSKCSTGDIIMSIRATVGTSAMLPESINGGKLNTGNSKNFC